MAIKSPHNLGVCEKTAHNSAGDFYIGGGGKQWHYGFRGNTITDNPGIYSNVLHPFEKQLTSESGSRTWHVTHPSIIKSGEVMFSCVSLKGSRWLFTPLGVDGRCKVDFSCHNVSLFPRRRDFQGPWTQAIWKTRKERETNVQRAKRQDTSYRIWHLNGKNGQHT